ncbi:hypothetical protein [Methanocella sp. MCL-LM]|uniref:hypothetical protein n=1 Tax=Methanocella sp. MCL-LM TaxID=3412035 RepID=UPI003C765CD0
MNSKPNKPLGENNQFQTEQASTNRFGSLEKLGIAQFRTAVQSRFGSLERVLYTRPIPSQHLPNPAENNGGQI